MTLWLACQSSTLNTGTWFFSPKALKSVQIAKDDEMAETQGS